MTNNEIYSIIQGANRAIDKIQNIKSIEQTIRVNSMMLFIPAMESMLFDNYDFSEKTLKSIKSTSNLIEKNQNAYDAGMINKNEYETNGKSLLHQLHKDAALLERKKKVSEMDLLTLRSGVNSLNNQS